MWHIYTMGYYLAIKKNEIMPFAATWMALESVILSEVSQRSIIWHPLYVESKRKPKIHDTNELTYKTETNRLRKQTYGCRGEGIVREFGKIMYTVLYSKWITNKDLLYSTWNSTQSFCASLDGRGLWGRMDTCICTAESLHWSPETTTTLLTGYTPIQNHR